jgi:hypothetical protein
MENIVGKFIIQKNHSLRFKRLASTLLGIFLFLTSCAWAGQDDIFSGKISLESGVQQGPGEGLSLYQFSRLMVESHNEVLPSLTLGLSGEGDWQASSVGLAPSWPTYPVRNLLNTEVDNQASGNGTEPYSLRLSRAYFSWTSGPLEINAGLRSFDWGSSYFYRPTDYFYPLSPLIWTRDQSLGSDALQASCYLFDFLSAETAVRWLQGGKSEWVARLVNKGIGITVSPSFADMSGRNGLGLELNGTFPEFQVRLEGVDWMDADGHASVNWIAGLSTVHDGMKYTAEVLRDSNGEILGNETDRLPQATYVFLSMTGLLWKEWKVSPALVAPLEGGPVLFWPKLSWGFSQQWEAGFQAQLMMGNWKGPLDLYPGRAGLSLGYLF